LHETGRANGSELDELDEEVDEGKMLTLKTSKFEIFESQTFTPSPLWSLPPVSLRQIMADLTEFIGRLYLE
jgi:hypothetical protein